MEQRITTRSAPTWSTHSHFANEYVAALTVRTSIGGTRNPDPVVSGNLSLRKAIVTIAVDAYSIRASANAASGATSASNRPAGRAGAATMTASACTIDGSRVEPITRFQPPSARRARSRTVEFR